MAGKLRALELPQKTYTMNICRVERKNEAFVLEDVQE